MTTSRRKFLATASLAAPAALLTRPAAAAEPAPARGKPFKVCLFSDLHYMPGVWTNTENTLFLEKILARAEAEKCDMVIHLGDFVHNVAEKNAAALIKKYNDFKIPTYHVLGNHDQDATSWKATCEAYRMPGAYYLLDKGGFRFIIADPNYFCEERGRYIHHDKGNYFSRSKTSTINWIPPEQLEWMRDAVDSSPFPCIVMSHQSFERPPNGHGVCNKEEVRKIFTDANAGNSGRVRLVINGHNHMDHMRILDNIPYWDVNSANYKYFSADHSKYPAEYLKTHCEADNNIGWTEPLSAVLSLYPDGRIKIDGSKADWLFGVSPEDAGYLPYDLNGRYILPRIQSTDMRLA